MEPLTQGYYLSEQFVSEEMHAGVRMRDSFFRFLGFFEDGHWIWSDRDQTDFDFVSFVCDLDLNYWRENRNEKSMPKNPERDQNYLFQFGTYKIEAAKTVLSFCDPVIAPDMELTFDLEIQDQGNRLRGWRRTFQFHSDFEFRSDH